MTAEFMAPNGVTLAVSNPSNGEELAQPQRLRETGTRPSPSPRPPDRTTVSSKKLEPHQTGVHYTHSNRQAKKKKSRFTTTFTEKNILNGSFRANEVFGTVFNGNIADDVAILER